MFGRKNKLAGQDKATKQLQSSGVYSLGHGPHPFIVQNETVEAVKTKKIYNFWSGVWYTTILSILLFWLPPFGQMIAGYVGGRKTGSPWKGALAALVPMSLIFLLFTLRYMGNFVGEIDWFLGLPVSSAVYVSTSLPVFGPVLGFMSSYIDTFITTLWSHEFVIYPYVLTIIFGYVGGILSLQRRREMEADGRDHPFIPISVVHHGGPIPFDEQAPEQKAAAQEEPQQRTDDPPVVKGKVPKGWKVKKDNKKGKW
jgi:hypothetical protein